MLTIAVFAAATAFFAGYLRWRGAARTLPEALFLIAVAAGVWTWFLAFRLSGGGLFSDGGAIVWTVVLCVIGASVVRRALKAQAARL